MHIKGILGAATLAFSLASPALAEGLTLKLEGGLGFNRGEGVGIVSIARLAPPTATSEFVYAPGMPRGPLSLGYRAEGTWAFDLGNGTRMRIGGVFSGIDGASSETTPVYYVVASGPGGPGNEPAFGEIRVCAFPNPCAIFEGELSRSYQEVMPELLVGRDGADGSMTWVGLQGFSGQLAENTSNRTYGLPGPVFDRTTLTELDADATGVMLALQHERPLKSGMTLFLGAGLGRYSMDATGFSVDPALPANAKSVSGSFDGTRAQLTVGIEKPVGKGLSLGATVRADYWTDQPRVQMDWTTPACNPSLCSPPSRIGNFTLTSDPMLSVTVGVSLTLRM